MRSVRLFDPPLCRTVNNYSSFFRSIFNEIENIARDLQNIHSTNQFKKFITPVQNLNTKTTDIFKYFGNQYHSLLAEK